LGILSLYNGMISWATVILLSSNKKMRGFIY
jgi:hypothetical protein